jgi:uncharacterized protein
MHDTIVILGASVRAAAFSALAAGLRPRCGDLFADADLAERAVVTAVRPYPMGFEAFALTAPPGPWMYTGAMENEPELVDRIHRRRPLYGNSGEVLRRVRDPVGVQRALAKAGLDAPDCRATSVGLPRDGSWLYKPLKSSGGRRVRVLNGKTSVGRDDSACYFQRRIEGLPCAAVYVAAGGKSQLLGVTEQLLRPAHPGAAPFRYTGSLGPLRLGSQATATFDQIGRVLSGEFELRGLFGVDAILQGDAVWPVEVNPRYTASVEVLERARAFSAVDLHVAACSDARLPPIVDPPSAPCGGKWCGKQILFAAAEVAVSRQFTEQALRENCRADQPDVADIPVPGTKLTMGQPVLTVLGDADSRAEMRQVLRERLEHWERWLYSGGS